MVDEEFEIIEHPGFRYKRLSPIPTEARLREFYEKQYYDLIRAGERAPDVLKTIEGGEKGTREYSWLSSTLYADISCGLEKHGHRRSRQLLDVGCGTGEFMAFMKDQGWDVVGLDLSDEAVAFARRKELKAFHSSIEGFIEENSQYSFEFDVVTMLHVLEHVPDPAKMLAQIKSLLTSNGLIVVVVPNDFNVLQLAAQKLLGRMPWWIAAPDHINYFDFQSILFLLTECGYDVVHSQGDFPMEVFLLMGEDYIKNSETGRNCHEKRVQFEISIPGELRRRIYQNLAEIGVGRNCVVIGRLDKK